MRSLQSRLLGFGITRKFKIPSKHDGSNPRAFVPAQNRALSTFLFEFSPIKSLRQPRCMNIFRGVDQLVENSEPIVYNVISFIGFPVAPLGLESKGTRTTQYLSRSSRCTMYTTMLFTNNKHQTIVPFIIQRTNIRGVHACC